MNNDGVSKELMVKEKKSKYNATQKSQRGQLREVRDKVLQREREFKVWRNVKRTDSKRKAEILFIKADYHIAQER